MVNMDSLHIAKNRLDTILIIDRSQSMRGRRISQVNSAISDIRNQLLKMQKENCDVEFYLTILAFSSEAEIIGQKGGVPVGEFQFEPIKAEGWTRVDLAYDMLSDLLRKKSHGGMMPDFGGLAPIMVLLTDGHMTQAYEKSLSCLRSRPWYRAALKYGIAIGLNDNRTIESLNDFVCHNGDVITSFNEEKLSQLIQIIVLTSSKMRSESRTCSTNETQQSSDGIIREKVKENLKDMEGIQWQ